MAATDNVYNLYNFTALILSIVFMCEMVSSLDVRWPNSLFPPVAGSINCLPLYICTAHITRLMRKLCLHAYYSPDIAICVGSFVNIYFAKWYLDNISALQFCVLKQKKINFPKVFNWRYPWQGDDICFVKHIMHISFKCVLWNMYKAHFVENCWCFNYAQCQFQNQAPLFDVSYSDILFSLFAIPKSKVQLSNEKPFMHYCQGTLLAIFQNCSKSQLSFQLSTIL